MSGRGDVTRLLLDLHRAVQPCTGLEAALPALAEVLVPGTGWRSVGAYRCPAQGAGALERVHDPSGLVVPDPVLAERARQERGPVVVSASGPGDARALVALPVLAPEAPAGRGAEPVVAVLEVLADSYPVAVDDPVLVELGSALAAVTARERTTADLADERDEAVRAGLAKSQFLATMSHEIRTPMTGVIGLNDLLLHTDLDDHQARLAHGVEQAGLGLLAILNDVLDLSKIEAGGLELEQVDFDVRSVFEQSAAAIAGRAHEKGLELVVSCAPDVPTYLCGDPTRLGQVLTNLGSNAVKFTESGEVVVEATVERARGRSVWLRVRVRDTGIGIPPEAQATLFDAFTQAELATTRHHGGTGLGLAICRQLVAAMGGRIGLRSAPGTGSEFTFTAQLGRASVEAAAEVDLSSVRSLVVDDHTVQRTVLRAQLDAWGSEGGVAADATAALAEVARARAAGRPYQVLLLDAGLPVEDGPGGLDAVALLAAQEAAAGAEPPLVVLLTTDHGVGSRAAHDAGVRDVLSKPVRHHELRSALARIAGYADVAEERRPVRLLAPGGTVRVLVVEDNPVNQLVATGLLEALGVEVSLADDGETALDALDPVDGPRADLVLMDCRMPGLDGFDTTRAVRALERTRGATPVPIIAMTASALTGERERCLAAGMDDYLTKPVDPARLEEALRRWLPDRTTDPGDGADPSAAEGATEPGSPGDDGAAQPATARDLPSDASPAAGAGALPVIDPERRSMLAELVKDGESFFDRTARSFASRIDGQLAAVRAAVEAHDTHTTFTAVHLVRGSALNLGLPRVAAAALALEDEAHRGRTQDAPTLLARVEAECAYAVEELRRSLG
ncbi:response regulator [Nocardioides sp. GY 10127]|uniref:response regulator n=1 Tax=Nocardioides sp. GY 10127 TaxID=2569762 RepID=UPI0010A7F6FD|nr:response regulator [Nocardioides sp. GY 10127]TIC80174.1 response regulator [Nocardioides sp. GY 10127]